MRDVTQAEADDYLVIVISDANIDRYGVSPEELTKSTPSLTLSSLSLCRCREILFLPRHVAYGRSFDERSASVGVRYLPSFIWRSS